MKRCRDMYDVMEVAQDASTTDIRKAWHRLSLLHHPDKRAGLTLSRCGRQDTGTAGPRSGLPMRRLPCLSCLPCLPAVSSMLSVP